MSHLNEIWFDYGTGQADGSGLMLFGSKTFVAGVAVNRAAVTSAVGDRGLQLLRHHGTPGGDSFEQSNLGTPGSGFVAGNVTGAFTDPQTLIDVILAFPVAGRNKLGFRLGVASGARADQPDGGDITAEGEFALKLQAGISLANPSLPVDIGLEIGFHSASDTDGGELNESGSLFVLGLRGRAFSRMSDRLDLGLLAEIGFGTSTIVHDDPSDTRNQTDIAVVLGAGPTYKLGKSTVNGHALLGFGSATFEPSTEGEKDIQSNSQILLPGVRLGFETPIIEQYLFFRSGMEYLFVIRNFARENGDIESDREGSPSFGWNAGFGLVLGKFKFDGAIQHSWLTAMPTAIGGGGNMLAIASASYDW